MNLRRTANPTRQADAILVMGEAMDTCETERAAPLDAARLAMQIRSVSDQLNFLLRTISD
jgi:hypothetical protein